MSKFMKKKRINLILKAPLKYIAVISAVIIFLIGAPFTFTQSKKIFTSAVGLAQTIIYPRSSFLSLKEAFAGDIAEVKTLRAERHRKETAPEEEIVPIPTPFVPKPAPPEKSENRETLPKETIPAEFKAKLYEETLTPKENNKSFVILKNASVRNYTKKSSEEILKLAEGKPKIKLPKDNSPAVLIYHTHTTESYETSSGEWYDSRHDWRSTDNSENMAAVGNILTEGLNRRGITTLHDVTQHDYPSYSGSYDRSRVTVKNILSENKNICVTLDLHRDGLVGDDDSITKTTVTVNGRKAAQLMVIAPCENGSVGVPDWQDNFHFAVKLCEAVNSRYPNLCRPIFFCYRHYNLDLTPNSLLIEIGTNGNTLGEASYTAELIAPIMAEVIKGYGE